MMGTIFLIMVVLTVIFVIGVKVSEFNKELYIAKGIQYEMEHLNKLIGKYEIPAHEFTLNNKRVMPLVKAERVQYFKGFPPIDFDRDKRNDTYNLTMYCWIEEDVINLVDINIEGFGKYSINLSDIVAYQSTGTVYNQLHISGGGGGGSSISGAILGGLIAGEAGAIIGSRNETREIKSTNTRVDERYTNVVYLYGGEEKLISFSGAMFDILIKTIPEKEATILANKSKINEDAPTKEQSTTSDKFNELHKLKEEGIITEQEYHNTRERLLNSI